jgi:hypothetical protein
MEKLLIKQLSKSNEAIGLITCLPKKINVFRSQDPQDLAPYKRALTFTPGPERFTLEHANKKLNSSDLVYIGTNDTEILTPENVERFENLLANSSIPTVVFEQLGLKESKKKTVKDLSLCELRRLTILELFNLHSKICILVNPFEPIAYNFREQVAEFLIEIAQTQEHIIIVPELNFRPNAWIDNSNIQRIEVGQNLQKTIGFGSAPSELQAMLEEVRQSVKEAPKANPSSMLNDPTPELMESPLTSKQTSKSRYFLLAGVGIIACGIFFFAQRLNIFGDFNLVKVKPVSDVNSTQLASNTNLNKQPQIEKIPQETKIVLEETKKVAKAKEEKKSTVLDLYPKEVKASLLATYSGSSKSVDYQNRKAKAVAPTNNIVKAGNISAGENLFEALKKTTGTGKANGSSMDTYSDNDSYSDSAESAPIEGSDEERREILREKFRAALERAAQR